MKQLLQEIVKHRYTATETIPFNVDEERTLISFDREDLESLIKTIVSFCADKVSNPQEREDILKIGD